jgi:hypothetical protein
MKINIFQKLKISKFTKRCFSNNNSYIKVNNDIKNFGKQFTDEEKKKYLDPFGFLSSTDCNYF